MAGQAHAATNETARLDVLRAHFLATSTQSVPLAGMLYWAVVGVCALVVTPMQLAYVVGFGSGLIFPLGLLIDKLRGKAAAPANNQNPVTQMFLRSLVLVGLLWPLVIIGAALAHSPDLVVLGAAILMGIVWIPYGWAADDPVGMQHAVARITLSYAAFLFAPLHARATVIAAVVLLCYAYSFVRGKKPLPVASLQ